MMKKLLMAASVALLALSFQASAAPVDMLKLSIEDNDLVDINRMSIVGSPFAWVSLDNIVVGSAHVPKGISFTHDWGLELGKSKYRNIAITTSFLSGVRNKGNIPDSKLGFVSAQLYTDTSFSVPVSENRPYEWAEPGYKLTKSNHTYGLRIAGYGGDAYTGMSGASYTFNVGGVVPISGVLPIPGAVWLFGSGMAGLLGLSRRKAKAAIPSV